MPSDTDDGTQLHNNADNLESSISKEEDEAEDEAEGVAKRAAGDELDETEQPAKKKRKL